MHMSKRKARSVAFAILSAIAVAVVALAADGGGVQASDTGASAAAAKGVSIGARVAGAVSSSKRRRGHSAGGPLHVLVLQAPKVPRSAGPEVYAAAVRKAVTSALRNAALSAKRKPQAVKMGLKTGLTLGLPISGVSADGTPASLFVVYGGDINDGDEFTISLYNDEGNPSSSVIEDGGLGQVGGGSYSSSSVEVTAMDVDPVGPAAVVQYQSPLDFVRPADSSNTNAAGDPDATSRYIIWTWDDETSGDDDGDAEFYILRPPVVLVHGLWDSQNGWNSFDPLLSDGRWSIQRADYSEKVGSLIFAWDPFDPNLNFLLQNQLTKAIQTKTQANSFGYSYNAPTVLNQIGAAIANFQNGQNPLGETVASIQADLVVHSMGGDISRYLPLLPNFYTASNFNQGPVHKVITIDTPHLGSPLAYDLLQSANECTRNIFTFTGKMSFTTVLLNNGQEITGSVNDLAVNPSNGTLSAALQQIHNSSTMRLPTALIASTMGPAQLNPINSAATAIVLRNVCGGDALAPLLTSAMWPSVFGGDSDAIVSLPSELDGLSSGSTTPFTAVHSGGAETIGFGPPAVQDQASGASAWTEDLLNDPVEDTSTYMTNLP